MLSGQDIPSSWPESHGLKEVLSSWRKPQLNTCWHAESNAIRSSGVKASEPSAYLPEKAMEKAAELQCFLQDPELPLTLHTPSPLPFGRRCGHAYVFPSHILSLFLETLSFRTLACLSLKSGVFLVSPLGALGLWGTCQYNGSAKVGLSSFH